MRLVCWTGLLLVGGTLGQANARGQVDPRTMVSLGEMPKVKLEAREGLSEEMKKGLREVIGSFTQLAKPDFGLSATLSGTNFSPLPGQAKAGVMLLTNHGIEPAEAVREVVTIGPEALPFLLERLDDKTATKIVIKHDFPMGAMWYGRELDRNFVSPGEKDVELEKLDEAGPRQTMQSYTVTVGDVCFVAIGQIVGRGYQAVRYQPTANIVVNSPSYDAKLCEAVRAIWKSDDPRRRVLDSLCVDYVTEGKFNGHSLDGWYQGSNLECRAARQMLFYFSKETAGLVASRLEKMDVSKDVALDDFMKRAVRNKVRSDDFIKAVAWSKEPRIQAALEGIFKGAGDFKSMMAALPAVEDKDLIRKRLEAVAVAMPSDDRGPYGEEYEILEALIKRVPEAAKGMCVRYLEKGGIQREHTVCVALRGEKANWDVEVLVAMLADKRRFGWTYAEVPGQNESRKEARVCDEAAVTLAENHPEVKFVQAGTYEEMDRQIGEMKKVLEKGK